MNFEEELKKGNFMIPECNKCKKIVWPPTSFCDSCFGKIVLKEKQIQGKIITFSKQKKEYFCVVEFEGNIKIIAKSKREPKKNQTVEIIRCGIENDSYFFEVRKIL